MASYRKAVASRGQEEPEVDPRVCRCYGCPCKASIDIDGAFRCALHAGKDSSRWQEITRQLREHDWLIGFIGTAEKLYRDGKDSELRKFAHDFWVDADHYMLPTEYEAKRMPLYLLRARGELAYRAGIAAKRPSPRVGPMELKANRMNNLPLPEVEEA